MLDQILMLFLKFKEDVKGQRYNLEYNQIAYMFVNIRFVSIHYHIQEFLIKSVISSIPSQVFESLSSHDHCRFLSAMFEFEDKKCL